MRKFQQRLSFRSFLYSWPFVLGLAALLFFLGRAAWNAYEKLGLAKNVYADARASRLEIEKKHADLTERLGELSSPYGLERELRERYGLHKPGEEVVIFVRRTPPDGAPARAADGAPSWRERLRTWIPTL
ncbi:MAG: hypothetical protein HYT22_02045 [Candidatus Niyogibacteria bacterium]|nr:hypothetical protein [Candidatus Niyogibacteria bacterium]